MPGIAWQSVSLIIEPENLRINLLNLSDFSQFIYLPALEQVLPSPV